jgi:hypothetical protein
MVLVEHLADLCMEATPLLFDVDGVSGAFGNGQENVMFVRISTNFRTSADKLQL